MEISSHNKQMLMENLKHTKNKDVRVMLAWPFKIGNLYLSETKLYFVTKVMYCCV